MQTKTHLNILSIAFAAASMLGCNEPEMEPGVPVTEYSVIGGDTVRTRVEKGDLIGPLYVGRDSWMSLAAINPGIVVGTGIVTGRDIELHKAPLDLGVDALKNSLAPLLSGKPLKYVAVGSSMTAGVRDGGYFNEGIMTSFPAILARQLGVLDFSQPLFSAIDYNGFGRNVRTDFNPTGGPVQKFARSSNNLAFESIGLGKLVPKKLPGQFHEYANMGLPGADLWYADFYAGEAGDIYPSRYRDWKQANMTRGPALVYGFVPLVEQYRKIEADFFTLEFASNFITSHSGFGRTGAPYSMPYADGPTALEMMLETFRKKGMKGCVMNIPSPKDFPYLKQIDPRAFYEQKKLFDPYGFDYEDFKDNGGVSVWPTSANDSVVSKIINIALKESLKNVGGGWSLIDSENRLNTNNGLIEKFAREYGYPIVDLKGLYGKILKGGYVTSDGVRVDPGLNGNFFSSDGVFPSAFGNALIANEVIRTLNSHYKTAIPLISTRYYLEF